MLKQFNQDARPKVGLGILIFNAQSQILLGKRKNAHGSSSWGPPGGHLEFGETFEQCAIRETLEETGLNISDPIFLAITNDVFETEGKHYLSIFMKADLTANQQARNLEPYKVEEWQWFFLNELPEHLFLPLEQLLSGRAYPVSETIIG
jgi:8-oxo-dGTP diphosphatase